MKFCSFGKNDQHTMENGEAKPYRQGRSREVLVAIVSSVVTAVVILAVVTSIFFGAKLCAEQEKHSKPEVFYVEISDDPRQANVQVRKVDKVILTESSGTPGHVDHTVTLQDFKRGLQSVKDLDRSKCFVFPVTGQFEAVEKIVDGNTNASSPKEVTFVNKTAARDPIPEELLRPAVGEHIAEFCEGLDSYWLVDPEDSGEQHEDSHQMVKRFIAHEDDKVKVTVEEEGDKTVITITIN